MKAPTNNDQLTNHIVDQDGSSIWMRLSATSPEQTALTFISVYFGLCCDFLGIAAILVTFFSGACQDAVTSSLPKCPMHFGELPSADCANDLEVMDSRHQPPHKQRTGSDLVHILFTSSHMSYSDTVQYVVRSILIASGASEQSERQQPQADPNGLHPAKSNIICAEGRCVGSSVNI